MTHYKNGYSDEIFFTENGYADIEKILDIDVPFIFCFGGRGTGKTYGALKHVVENDVRFILMRRTQSQADIINKPELSPFKSLNTDMEWNITTATISKYNAGFYHSEFDGEKYRAVGAPIGYTAALSTISNVRGFDAHEVKLVIYDEFIPEPHEKAIKSEGAAFMNAYETINRNRELPRPVGRGEKPLKMLCLANANDLSNPLFIELGLVKAADKMTKRGKTLFIDNDKGVALVSLAGSPISDMKSSTALYRLTKGSGFEDMAIRNDFRRVDEDLIASRPLREYKPVVIVGELAIYEHKSNGTLYATTHKSGSCPVYGTTAPELARFRRAYMWLWQAYLSRAVEFEEQLCIVLFDKYF